MLTSGQAARSWYMGLFRIPGFSERVLSRNDFSLFRRGLLESRRGSWRLFYLLANETCHVNLMNKNDPENC